MKAKISNQHNVVGVHHCRFCSTSVAAITSQEFELYLVTKVAKCHQKKFVKPLQALTSVLPLVTEENLIAEVNKGARVFGCIQTDRLQQKERVELIFSTIAQTSPFLKLTRIPDGVTARKRAQQPSL